MKDETFPLGKAIHWFLEDRATDIAESTWLTYKSHLYGFLNWLPEDQRTLGSLSPDAVEDYIRPYKVSQHTAMNKMIALKALARFLAEKKAWYIGSDEARISVLTGTKTPKASKHGMAGYNDSELRAILDAAAAAPNPDLMRAIFAVELHGFRSKETRMLLLKNVIFGRRGEMGHFIITDRDATKTAAGVRIVPMEPIARQPLMDYITGARPEHAGDGEETLFLSDEGEPFTDSGWHSMMQRFKKIAADEGVKGFKQHRLRVSRAKQLHANNVPETAILEMLGWEGPAMLRRYLGRISTAQLKTYPGVLDKVFGKAM